MAISAREKYIAIAVGAVIGLAGLDLMIIDPFIERGQAIATQRSDVEDKLHKADVTFKRRKALRPVWADMTASGGLRSDSFKTQNEMIQTLQGWAQLSGVSLTSWNPNQVSAAASVDHRADKAETKFDQIVLHASGYGPMAAMTRLLWKLESSPKLLKVTEVHIQPREEGKDDLQIQLTVATVSLIPGASQADNAPDNSRPVANAAGTGVQP